MSDNDKQRIADLERQLGQCQEDKARLNEEKAILSQRMEELAERIDELSALIERLTERSQEDDDFFGHFTTKHLEKGGELRNEANGLVDEVAAQIRRVRFRV